jgi:hypothetical protein
MTKADEEERMIRCFWIKPLVFLYLLTALATPASAAKTKVDFNGDGKADTFLQNSFTGEMGAFFSSGSGVLQHVSYGSLPPASGWSSIALSDFNGDGRTDMLVRNADTGEVGLWVIDGANVQQKVSLGVVAPEWAPFDVNDYSGDGRADLLWRNYSTGEIYLIDLSGQSGSVGAVDPATGWLPIAFGDFNGDGSTDLFWRRASTGEMAVWLMHGPKATMLPLRAVDPASNWAPIITADFTGDGRSDLLLRNSATGALYLAILDGNRIVQEGFLGPAIDPSQPWAIVGLGDFNGDGSKDLLWRNAATGDLYVWLVNGLAPPHMLPAGGVHPKTGWYPIGTDDYNGDGRTDILWRSAFVDDLYLWLMNGNQAQVLPFSELPPSSVWQVQIPR